MPKLSIAACSCALLGSACSWGDQFRGSDHGAWLPAVRASWAFDGGREPIDAERVTYRPTLQAGFTQIDGDVTAAGDRADYRVDIAQLVFAPEIRWRDVQVAPFVGAAYGDAEVHDATARITGRGLGVAAGVDLSYRGWQPLAPYLRYTEAGGPEWRAGRYEVGAEVRVHEHVGLQFAYARQISRIDELFLAGDGARIDSDGLHLGLVVRF